MEFRLKLGIQEKFIAAGGIIASLVAIWHVLMIAGGPSWYAFARAPQYIVDSAAEGTLIAPLGAIAIALLMFICAAYAFSAAGLLKKIPLVKPALTTIAVICLVRSLILSPIFFSLEQLGVWHLVASSGWFFVGVCFLLGAIKQFSKK